MFGNWLRETGAAPELCWPSPMNHWEKMVQMKCRSKAALIATGQAEDAGRSYFLRDPPIWFSRAQKTANTGLWFYVFLINATLGNMFSKLGMPTSKHIVGAMYWFKFIAFTWHIYDRSCYSQREMPYWFFLLWWGLKIYALFKNIQFPCHLNLTRWTFSCFGRRMIISSLLFLLPLDHKYRSLFGWFWCHRKEAISSIKWKLRRLWYGNDVSFVLQLFTINCNLQWSAEISFLVAFAKFSGEN